MYPGLASDMHFKNITMVNAQNPVIIDQAYCPNGKCSNKVVTFEIKKLRTKELILCLMNMILRFSSNVQEQSKVKISNVSFQDITGTSASPIAVELTCSSLFPCQNVQLNNIGLTYSGGVSKSQCTNVRPIITGSIPPGC